MISCARATRGLRRPSLDARNGRANSHSPVGGQSIRLFYCDEEGGSFFTFVGSSVRGDNCECGSHQACIVIPSIYCAVTIEVMCWVSESSLPVAQFVRELGIFDNVRYRWISRQRQVQGTLATLRDDREELVALKREGLAVAPEAGGACYGIRFEGVPSRISSRTMIRSVIIPPLTIIPRSSLRRGRL